VNESPFGDTSKSSARKSKVGKLNLHNDDEIDTDIEDEDIVNSSDDEELPVAALMNKSPRKSSTKKRTPNKSSTKQNDSNSKSSIRKSLLFSNNKSNKIEKSNDSDMKSLARKSRLNEASTTKTNKIEKSNDSDMKSLARKSRLNEASTTKKVKSSKTKKIDKYQQTLTQMDKKNKLKPKGKKNYKVQEECIYDISATEELPCSEIYKKSIDVDDERPLEIINARKGNGWKMELLLTYTNGLRDWVFIGGVWDELPNETEEFMEAVGIDFELCGYETDPRFDIKIRSDYDELGKERADIDFDDVTVRIRKKLLEMNNEREKINI
jgi:hypothetical protein